MFGVKSGHRNLVAALRDLHSERSEVRVDAVADLARHVDAHRSEVLAGLLEALDDTAGAVRAAAAVAIADADLGDDSAIDGLLARLRDDNEHVRQMVLVALGELGAARAGAGVERMLRDSAAPVRFQAVIAFPRVCRDHDQALRALLAASRDEDGEVRHIALRMAEEVGVAGGDPDDESVSVDNRFIQRALTLLKDDDERVRVTSAVVLGHAGRVDGAKVLVAVASRKIETDVAEDEAAAIELCGELGLTEAIEPLRRRAFGGVPLLRRDPFSWQARVALAALGDEQAVKWILSNLRGWNRERRTLAVAAAMRARLMVAKPLLEEMRGKPARADQRIVEEALATLADEELATLADEERSLP